MVDGVPGMSRRTKALCIPMAESPNGPAARYRLRHQRTRTRRGPEAFLPVEKTETHIQLKGLGLNLVTAIGKLHGFRFTIVSGPGCVVEIACPYALTIT